MQDKKFYIYSLTAAPLAFIGIPIYVYIANFYSNLFDLSIASIGLVILLSRVFDFIQDPIIGYYSDHFIQKGYSHQFIIAINSPFLALSFYFLFNPLFTEGFAVLVWLFACLVLVYSFFSIIVINYNAIAAKIAKNYSARTKVTAIREFFGLIGIIFASILPTLIARVYDVSFEKSLSLLALILFPILIICVIILMKFVTIEQAKSFKVNKKVRFFANLSFLASDKRFLKLSLIFFVNSLAVSLPAATFLFFVEDVLLAKSEAGFFLLLYFLTAALMMPLWHSLAKNFGKKNSWALSILLSVAVFFWAFFLSDQNYTQFYYICFFSGMMLGADLAIPPSILADIVNSGQQQQSKTSLYFSIWNMISKSGLAIASGFALIFLGGVGYRGYDSSSAESLFYLSLIYAMLPCIIKIITVLLLFFSNIDKFNKNEKN